MIKKSKSILSCYHMKYCLQKYTIYQFTYFIDVFNHGMTKDPKLTLIRYLHQKIHTKYDCNVENSIYLCLNINHIGFTGEPVTG